MMNQNRVWIYCRAAHENPAGLDVIENQKNRLERYAELNSMKVVGMSSDVQSGLTLDRPGLREVDLAVENQLVNVVLVVSLDRLCRKVGDLIRYWHNLHRNGVQLYTAHDGEVDLSMDADILETLDIRCA